jgi:RNA-directed DNA polymerase
MTKTSITLQELRKRIYIKAKAEPAHRFWGLYVHVCKMETLREGYRLAKLNNGAPGIDGLTFDEIERSGAETFLQSIHQSLKNGTYQPVRNRNKEIPKGGGKMRTLGIPTIRDRVVQAALKLILEPVFEADFQEGSFGYRPKRTAHQALKRVEKAIVQKMTLVIDLDLKAYFDTVKHHILLEKVAKRINDDDIMHLLKQILKAGGKEGVPQGGVISPLLSNLYLNEVDKMLEKAKATTPQNGYQKVEYARFADDLVVLVDGHWKSEWIWQGVNKRLREELNKLQVQINETKTKCIDLSKQESFNFLGFIIRIVFTRTGKKRPQCTPKIEKRTALLKKLGDVFKRYRSQPLTKVRDEINPILRGWVNYFRVGHSSKTFSYIREWLNHRLRRHLMRAKGKRGFGWKQWSTTGLLAVYNIYRDFKLTRYAVASVR